MHFLASIISNKHMYKYDYVCVVFVNHIKTEKLGVAPETVRHGVEGLMYLLTECSKLMV